MKRTDDILRRLHHEQSGAVMIMLLAAFLVLFMLGLVLYDSGVAARDKMESQVAADTSAFAHSNVKARGMNMIVYGNIIKRMFYAYMHTYVAGWSALMGAFAIDDAACLALNANACGRAARELALIAAELAEAPSNMHALMSPDGRSRTELAALEATQSYLADVTPWWAWVENFTRAYQNGAFVTMTWPPPSSDVTAVKDFVNRAGGVSDRLLGTDIMRALPPNTYNTDNLPVVRRDKDALLSRWNVQIATGELLAHVSYCDQYHMSYEGLVLQAQYLVESTNIWTMKAAFLTNILMPTMSCMATGVVYGDEVLDWKIAGGHFGRAGRNAIGGAIAGNNDEVTDEWLTKTSSLTIAYRPRAGRMSDADKSGRGKFAFVEKDYRGIGSSELYRNSGYWSVARSELVYVPKNALVGLSEVMSGMPFGIDEIVDTTAYTPDMWTPAWTGRLRPTVLPDEQIATSTTGEAIGLEAMFWDSAAYFLLASAVTGAVDEGLGGDQHDLSDLGKDLVFLHRATAGYGPDEMEGITK